MKSIIWVALLLIAPLASGCSGRAQAVEPAKRRETTTFNMREHLESEARRARAERAREAAEQDARLAASTTAAQAEAARAVKRLDDLASAMFQFGIERLPAAKKSPVATARYKRHLRYVAGIILTAAKNYTDRPLLSVDEDPYLLAAVAFHESSWAQHVVDGRRRGLRGEIGLMQLMPGGFCSFAEMDDNGRRLDPLDPVNNVRLATGCLLKLQTRYHEPDVWRTLARYASGKEWPAGRDSVDNPENGFRVIYEAIRAERPSQEVQNRS
jgi:soluble lytic murein transglycosylase-like protein